MPDPSDPQNLNRYSYVLNNPLKYTDPSGHRWLDITDEPLRPSASIARGCAVGLLPWSAPFYSFRELMPGSGHIYQFRSFIPFNPRTETHPIFSIIDRSRRSYAKNVFKFETPGHGVSRYHVSTRGPVLGKRAHVPVSSVLGKVTQVFKWGGAVATVAMAGFDTYNLYQSYQKAHETGDYSGFKEDVGKTVGTWAGAVGGAKAGCATGATIGSTICPGVGTAVGGVVGGVIGAIMGAIGGSKLGEWIGGLF